MLLNLKVYGCPPQKFVRTPAPSVLELSTIVISNFSSMVSLWAQAHPAKPPPNINIFSYLLNDLINVHFLNNIAFNC